MDAYEMGNLQTTTTHRQYGAYGLSLVRCSADDITPASDLRAGNIRYRHLIGDCLKARRHPGDLPSDSRQRQDTVNCTGESREDGQAS